LKDEKRELENYIKEEEDLDQIRKQLPKEKKEKSKMFTIE